MRLGYFAPLPPAPTGVADYAAQLLDSLRAHGTVLPNQPGDVNLYQIGNNPLHAAIYERALAEPGVVLLHDGVLHHLLLGLLSREQYQDEFVYNYGAGQRDWAERLWMRRGQAGADEEFFRYPLLKRLGESARAFVVHNAAAARLVREHAPATPVHVVPHLAPLVPTVDAAAVRLARVRLGAGEQTLVVGVFGHLRPTKRLRAVLRAVERVGASAGVRLLVAGEAISEEYEREVAQLSRSPLVQRQRFLPEAKFWVAAHAVDVCASLRHPSVAETSGIAIRLMAAGRPVLVTEGDEWADLPRGTHWPVPAGPDEEEVLAALLLWAARHPAERALAGAAAREHLHRVHAPAQVAAQVWRVVTG